LAAALGSALRRAGSSHRAVLSEQAASRWRTARVGDGQRRAHVYLNVSERRFDIFFKVHTAHGAAGDLVSTVDMVRRSMSGARYSRHRGGRRRYWGWSNCTRPASMEPLRQEEKP
jgi:hypothetical protein